MITSILQFGAGLLVENLGEWVIHRYVLHGLGKKKGSFWSFHWKEHHNNCRRDDFRDVDYFFGHTGWNAQGKEIAGLVATGFLVTPALFVSGPFVAGIWSALVFYYIVHRAAHVWPSWARRWLPWHYDHHMNKNQDANWCVTYPLTDVLLRTREKSTKIR